MTMAESRKIAKQIASLTIELAKTDIELALEVSLGIVVNLYEEVARRDGYDPSANINITGGVGQRKVTIHSLENSGN